MYILPDSVGTNNMILTLMVLESLYKTMDLLQYPFTTSKSPSQSHITSWSWWLHLFLFKRTLLPYTLPSLASSLPDLVNCLMVYDIAKN